MNGMDLLKLVYQRKADPFRPEDFAESAKLLRLDQEKLPEAIAEMLRNGWAEPVRGDLYRLTLLGRRYAHSCGW